MIVARRAKIYGMTEIARRSKLRRAPQRTASNKQVVRKSFWLLACTARPARKNYSAFSRACSRDRPRAVIQGRYTQTTLPSIPKKLAEAFAWTFQVDVKDGGLEDVLSNELSHEGSLFLDLEEFLAHQHPEVVSALGGGFSSGSSGIAGF